MFNGEMRKPIIQSLIVIIAIIILIGFVAGSGADSLGAGLLSIIKGIFYTILFVIGLAVAIVVSIAILMAVYFGAVAMHSPSESQSMFSKIKENISHGFCSVTSGLRKRKSDSSVFKTYDEKNKAPNQEIRISAQKIKELSAQIVSKNDQIETLKDELKLALDKVADLEIKLNDAEVPPTDQTKTSPIIEEAPLPTNHRLFNYFANEGEKQAVARIVHQAVKEDMTYKQIDEFLSQALPKKLVKTVMEHPSLKKEYIRQCRKQRMA